MIMIIAVIFIFLSYVMFDQQLKILRSPPEKIHSPLFTHSPPKNSKSESPSFLPTLKTFQALSRKGERTLWNGLSCLLSIVKVKYK